MEDVFNSLPANIEVLAQVTLSAYFISICRVKCYNNDIYITVSKALKYYQNATIKP